MADALATGSALYYPYIHVHSLDHLKAALVYWDRVRRIVPDMMRYSQDRQYAVDDSDDARLLADHGLLVCTDPVLPSTRPSFNTHSSRSGSVQRILSAVPAPGLSHSAGFSFGGGHRR